MSVTSLIIAREKSQFDTPYINRSFYKFLLCSIQHIEHILYTLMTEYLLT